MRYFLNGLVIASAVVLGTASTVPYHALGAKPNLPYDPNTTPYCAQWFDHEGFFTCQQTIELWDIVAADFFRWNPSISSDCGNYQAGRSYCIEVLNEPAPVTSSSITSTRTTSSSSTPSPTKPANGIETPQPIQPGMVGNCDSFYKVKLGEGCESIATKNGISVQQFYSWNPFVGSDCSGLWTDFNVCVSIVGHTPAPPTPTNPGNGITTPEPIQPGMVNNCRVFYLTKTGDACADIATKNGITLAQFNTWNPLVGTTCSGMWANAYVCVSIIGHTPAPPTPTNPGNGITTPQPIQPGMVNNCRVFYLTKTGDACTDIATKNGITLAQFNSWNPLLGPNCSGMWASAYVCISIIGHTPTPINPGNGISTPMPIQTGMTTSCKSFHFIRPAQTCAVITTQYRISLADFIRWNPAAGSTCTGLWADTYACVAVL